MLLTLTKNITLLSLIKSISLVIFVLFILQDYYPTSKHNLVILSPLPLSSQCIIINSISTPDLLICYASKIKSTLHFIAGNSAPVLLTLFLLSHYNCQLYSHAPKASSTFTLLLPVLHTFTFYKH